MAAPLTHGACCAGLTAAERADKDEAPGLAGREGFEAIQTSNAGDCAEVADADNRRANLRARAALLGLVLHEIEGGACLLVGETGPRCHLPSLQAAEALVYGVEHVRTEVAALVARLSAGGAR